LSAVVGYRLSRYESLAAEAMQDAAQVACVEGELLSQAGCSGRGVVMELIQDTNLGQRIWTFEKVLVQSADLSRIEAIEAANSLDAGVGS
jgi:hypothetical protein